MVFLHPAHFQMPVETRFTLKKERESVGEVSVAGEDAKNIGFWQEERPGCLQPGCFRRREHPRRHRGSRLGSTHLSFPQKVHEYFECCETSIFLITFRIEAPYRVPYLPVMPTFFVRRPILGCRGRGWRMVSDMNKPGKFE